MRRAQAETEGGHTVNNCYECGNSNILVQGMRRPDGDTCEIHTCQRCDAKLHYNHSFSDQCTLNTAGTSGHRYVSGIRVDYSKLYRVG